LFGSFRRREKNSGGFVHIPFKDTHPEDPAATVHEAHVLDFQTPPGPQRQGTAVFFGDVKVRCDG